ncbi:MAG: RtcB family protein [Myxococcales bacterium]|nr:RtcB family protein [Myxococcales bacterium]MCB9542718.1 RtcB family protein [Myxococcales bacterium]
MDKPRLEQIDDWRWEIPQTGGMRVPGRIYASRRMVRDIQSDRSPEQVRNVAHLPGIVGHSLAMPDMHWGYGFPIGGVAAFDPDEGVLSPGGVGYDINCGVRLLRTDIPHEAVRDGLPRLANALHAAIPAGVGQASRRALDDDELEGVMRGGAQWAIERGFGRAEDTDTIEEGGRFDGADPGQVGERARERGKPQLGSLGSGNHFCELGVVDAIYDPAAAAAFGLEEGKLTVMIHSGSRGFGHQICDESLRMMLRASERHGIELPDRQLCAAPLGSDEAKRYFGAMACAINFAFANRQVMTHHARRAIAGFLGEDERALGLELVYDVCHNIAKWEEHTVDGETRRLCVHRKGATRAFGPDHPKNPKKYTGFGQPVIVPGDMGRYSFVLAGTARAMAETFGSSCHGAGRKLSRAAARKAAQGRSVFREMADRGVLVRSDDRRTVAEEMPDAYKDVADVVEVIAAAGIAERVARLKPLAVIKG